MTSYGRGPRYPLGELTWVCRPCRLVDLTELACPKCGEQVVEVVVFNVPSDDRALPLDNG